MKIVMNKIINGDCIEVMRGLEADSIDTIITDPPYGLSFMGKAWDYDVPGIDTWKECLRVTKPGGTALIFAGSRTQHRMAVAVEDAGWILKDCIMWLYGSGFPKATDIGKKVKKFEGWKSHGLKPAYEPILVAMKPNDGTYANNTKHGVSGLNIDGARIGTETRANPQAGFIRRGRTDEEVFSGTDKNRPKEDVEVQGRFPANVILDEEAGRMLDEQSGVSKSIQTKRGDGIGKGFHGSTAEHDTERGHNDKGGASRFFYCAKASKAERNKGCEGLEEKAGIRSNAPRENEEVKTPSRANNHPTVKPLALMEYLCTLTKTPTAGVVLDPFAGSGTTGVACKKTGRDYILIEKEKEYIKIIKARLSQQTLGI